MTKYNRKGSFWKLFWESLKTFRLFLSTKNIRSATIERNGRGQRRTVPKKKQHQAAALMTLMKLWKWRSFRKWTGSQRATINYDQVYNLSHLHLTLFDTCLLLLLLLLVIFLCHSLQTWPKLFPYKRGKETKSQVFLKIEMFNVVTGRLLFWKL